MKCVRRFYSLGTVKIFASAAVRIILQIKIDKREILGRLYGNSQNEGRSMSKAEIWGNNGSADVSIYNSRIAVGKMSV